MSLISLFCQSICFGPDAMYSLTSFRSLSKRTSCASKWTRRPLRKRKSTVAPRPAGWVISGSNCPQAPRIWSSCFFFQPPLASPWRPRLRFQVLGGPVELAAVLEDRRQTVQGLFILAGLGIVGDRLVDLDRVELVGKLEPLDAGGEPGDRFVIRACRAHRGPMPRGDPSAGSPPNAPPPSSGCRTG